MKNLYDAQFVDKFLHATREREKLCNNFLAEETDPEKIKIYKELLELNNDSYDYVDFLLKNLETTDNTSM